MGGLNKIITSLAPQAPVPLLTYNPGPGIYSRLERAIEQMPETVRAKELPGLLKRYKDGVPGWELKATDLDEVLAGRDVVPRSELLARVKERSPVYTHGEVILGGRPQIQHVPTGGTAYRYDADTNTSVRLPDDTRPVPDYQFPDTGEPSRIGLGVSHGEPKYRNYSQGGDDYTELLLTQPGARGEEFRSHWADSKEAVAHARFDVHDGYLRVNELQSDLGIHNRKMREQAAQAAELLIARGAPRGSLAQPNDLPFPLEDAALELLLKRLNLIVARQGLRGVEIASPRSIADTVGGNIDNYEHAYGKVAVGQQERLGRKLGGMESVSVRPGPEPVRGTPYSIMEAEYRARDDFESLAAHANMYKNPDQVSAHGLVEDMVDVMRMGQDATPYAERLQRHMVTQAVENGWPPRVAEEMVNREMQGIMRQAENWVNVRNQKDAVAKAANEYEPPPRRPAPPIYRGTMSDEMRRRIIEQGIGASVLAPLLMQDGE